MEFHHIPVLYEETLTWLNLKPGHLIADCTLGGAGHSQGILEGIIPGGHLIGIDRDPAAIATASERLKTYEGSFTLFNANYESLPRILDQLGYEFIDGVLYDLGVSSHQLDEADRGFSYMTDAPLDMRMDPQSQLDAKMLVNTAPEAELTRIIREYGEERWASRIAAFIIKERVIRPIETTGQLVDVIKSAIPAAARRSGPHPARRTFQALRIAVNDELGTLDRSLKKAISCLRTNGRICVITFHSLEDRIVKHIFQEAARGCICPPDLPVCVCGLKPELKVLTRKPIEASEDELVQNPRARSAKLRVAEKI
jgi:16S rRNA (cytosine1402-N4)-methyltransferase